MMWRCVLGGEGDGVDWLAGFCMLRWKGRAITECYDRDNGRSLNRCEVGIFQVSFRKKALNAVLFPNVPASSPGSRGRAFFISSFTLYVNPLVVAYDWADYTPCSRDAQRRDLSQDDMSDCNSAQR